MCTRREPHHEEPQPRCPKQKQTRTGRGTPSAAYIVFGFLCPAEPVYTAKYHCTQLSHCMRRSVVALPILLPGKHRVAAVSEEGVQGIVLEVGEADVCNLAVVAGKDLP